jgi:murein DD-endopeptidase MepM/ murein hydrolase activator NlpD
MTRRIIGVDPPQTPGAVLPQVSPIQVDTTAARQQFDQAAQRTEQTYQAQLQAQDARASAIAAEASRQSGTAMQEILQGVVGGFQLFGQITEQRQKAEQAKLAAEKEAQEEIWRQNATEGFTNISLALSRAQDFISETADREGFYATELQIVRAINQMDISPQDRERLVRYAQDELRNFQRGQLGRIRSEVENTQSAVIANVEAETQRSLINLTSGIRKGGWLSAEAVGVMVGEALAAIDESVFNLPQNLPVHAALSMRARLLDTLNAAIGENYEAAAILTQAVAQQEQWEAEANQILIDYADNPQLQNAELRRLQARISGQNTFAVTTEADVYQEYINRLEQQKKLNELTAIEQPDADLLSRINLAEIVYGDLNGQFSIEHYKDMPGYGQVYIQLRAARDAIQRDLGEYETYEDRVNSLQRDKAKLEADLARWLPYAQIAENFESASEEDKRRFLRAQQDGTIPSSTQELVSNIQASQHQLNAIQDQEATAMRRYNEARQRLAQYGFQDGLAGFTQNHQRLVKQAETSGALQRLADVDQQEQNFPTSASLNAPPPRALVRVGGNNAAGLDGVLAPFSGVNAGEVHITSATRNDDSSHSYGSAIDFAISGNPNNRVPVTALVSGRVTDVVNRYRPGQGTGYGNLVEITTRDGRKWLYAHLGDVNVSVGDVVTQGNPIGLMSDTGTGTNPHVHVQVNESDGSHVPYREWLPSVQPEIDARNHTNGLGGLGMTPTSQPRTGANAVPTELPPPEALQLPGGIYYFAGRFYRNPAGTGASSNLTQTREPPNPSAMNPLRPQRASSFASDYTNPHRQNDNYGYAFLRDNNGFRNQLHQTARRLGIPSQWLADTIATLTGGTFTRGWRDGRVGIFGFTEADAQRLGVNLNDVANMNHAQQLELVEKYLSNNGSNNGRYTNLERLWMAAWYNPDIAMEQDITRWVNNPGVRRGLEQMPRIGNAVGRRYNTIYDLFGGDHTTHTGQHANCPTCAGVQNAGSGTTSPTNEPMGRRVASTNLRPEEAAMLDTIAFAEGTYADDGYFTNVGYTNRTQGWQPFRSISGEFGTSNATGRYQFMSFTWDAYGHGLDINNPAHQDQAALRLIREKRRADAIFDAIRNNDYATFDRIVNGSLGLEWVGLTQKQNYPGQAGNTPTEQLWRFARERYNLYRQGNRSTVPHTR